MRRVIALELVGLEKLDCDLYDEAGKVVYQKGTPFTPELLMKLSYSNLYKRDEEVLQGPPPQPVEEVIKGHQDDIIKEFLSGFELPRSEYKPDKAEFKSLLDDKKKDFLKSVVKNILASVNEGQIPKTSSIIEATEIVLEEVYEKMDTVNNINELRIHDYYTYAHSINVAVISAMIGRTIGLHENKVKDLVFSGLLHDIGKMKVSKEILYKPGVLKPEELYVVKNHAQLGYDHIVNNLKFPDYVARAALEHHERWDGSGYPNGLKGNKISEFGQIVAIADVYDALVSEKVYKGSIPSVDAIRLMLTEESSSFNPDILYKFTFLSVVKDKKVAS